MYSCFNGGVIYGVISAVILGIVWLQIKKAKGNMGKRNKPLNTFPDAIQPKLTPGGIVRESVISMFAYFFWILIFIAAFVMAFWFFPFFRASVCYM